MKSKILIEQDIDWDEEEKKYLDQPIDTSNKVVVKKKPDTTLTPKPKPDPDPDPDPKPKPDTTLSNEEVSRAIKQFKLIQNAVQFYENISKLGRYINWDEERMQNVFVKFSMTNRDGMTPIEMAKYCDVIYRILFKMSGTRKSNSAAYEYWLSRNYASSTSWEYLQSISVPDYKSYEDWFKGDRFDYMDWDEFANTVYLKNIFSKVDLKQIKNKPSTVALTLKSKFTNDEIHKMVLSAYKNKIWGEPRGTRKNMGWIGVDSKKKKK